MPTETERATVTLWRHPRTVVLGLLALCLIVAMTPFILARDSAWLFGWSNITFMVAAIATALKCLATARRLQGQQRTSWHFITLTYLSYAFADTTWAIYELVLDIPNPIMTIADVGYTLAPIFLLIGTWLYRRGKPALSTVLVQFGNAGILVAAIFLANMIIFQPYLKALNAPGLSSMLISYEVIATTAFVFALFNIGFYIRGRRRLVMMPLLFALGALAVSNYFTFYEVASGVYTSTTYANIGYYFMFACGYWAAFEQDHLGEIPAADPDLQASDEVARQWETLLPSLAVVGLLGVALAHREDLTADLIPHAIAALLLFISASALRDWWMQREETELRGETRKTATLLQESEQSLIAKNEELAATNRELSREIIARMHIQEELRHSQKMEVIGQLTGGVAHDFNNLLAVIIGNVDLLEQTLEPDSSQRAYTQEAAAAANRGAALTERLLAFSRKQALDPRPIEVNDLLKSMTTLLERTLGETIQLRFEMSEDITPCMVDRAQLENAILNLVINARDAMHGGGLITIETSNVALGANDIATNPEAEAGNFVLISVRDTGVGMHAHIQARVFEPFFTTKDVGAGSGLGLSMVYGFVRQSGGHVSIESEEGVGTEVRLYLPQTDLPPDSIEGIDVNSVPSGQRESVLVVEDDSALRKVIVSFLNEQNYQVAAASESSEALAILDESGPFDLLLSDVILPGELSGQELAKEITHIQPSIKILLMSGYASDVFEEEGGIPDYANLLQKPFSMGALARKLRFVLEAEEADDSDSD